MAQTSTQVLRLDDDTLGAFRLHPSHLDREAAPWRLKKTAAKALPVLR